MESCLLCKCPRRDHPSGNPGRTGESIKALFQYLNVVGNVVRHSSVEKEASIIASKICQDCAIMANGFGTMSESFDKALQNFLKDWILTLKLASGRANNTSQIITANADATFSTPEAGGLRAEILKKWELKLNPNPDKPNEEGPLPLLDDQVHDDNVLEAEEDEGGRRSSRHRSDEAGQVAMMMMPPHTVNGGNEMPVAAQQDDWRPLACMTAENHDVDQSLDQFVIMSTSLPTSTSTPTTTTTTITKSRICPYPNCGIRFRGPKASEKKHYTCVHTLEHFPDQFFGFSQKDVNDMTRNICSQEFSQNLEELNTFKCPFCAASSSGIKETDKKFHLLEQHKEVVKSRLEARMRVVVAIKANKNLADDAPTNFVDEPQQKTLQVAEQWHQVDLPIVREEENGDEDVSVGGDEEGELDELPEGPVVDEIEEEVEEEEQSDEDDHDMMDDDEELEEEGLDERGDDDQLEDVDDDDDDSEETEEDEMDHDQDSSMSDDGDEDDSNLKEDDDDDDDDGPPKLEAPNYPCSFCPVRLYGPRADLTRHEMVNHTLAYFSSNTRTSPFPGSATEEDVDRAIRALCQQGLFSDPADHQQQDTFTCSFCQQSVTGDKKYHLLQDHLDLVQSRLNPEIGGHKVAAINNTEEPPPPSSLPLLTSPPQMMSINEVAVAGGERQPVPAAAVSPPPEVEEIETTVTGAMIRRQRDKTDFDKNREVLRADISTKPRFTLIFLIQQAIAESPNKELKTKDIFKWVQVNVGYYRNPSNGNVEKTLPRTISSTLSSNPTFVKVGMDGSEGIWRVNLKEFYKAGRKLSTNARPRRSKSKSSGVEVVVASSSNPTAAAVNVKREVLEGNLSFQQSGSTGSDEQIVPTHVDLEQANNQVERAMEVENRRRRRSRRSHSCRVCNSQIVGGKWNLDRHLVCVHSTHYFSHKLTPGTSQEDLNKAVARLCRERVTKVRGGGRRRRNKFRCSLCGTTRTGDKRYHLLKKHLKKVMSRVEREKRGCPSRGGGRGGVPPPPPTASNFDAAAALQASSSASSSADLLGGIMHIKQEERTMPMEQE